MEVQKVQLIMCLDYVHTHTNVHVNHNGEVVKSFKNF